ncbi:MAG: adenylate/guanylate cyclase domain-containing protein, partial [Actinobacteria bacterium]|nr:adenylate/guanylate cyclase domain-containing protein [Actinomycetota bacterium]
MAAVHIVVMFTDLVGSTDLSFRLEVGEADALRQTHFRILRQAIATHAGSEVKTLGDGLMVLYPSASAALEAAVAIQQGMAAHNHQADPLLFVRIGISAGEATQENGDYFGDPVVEAARLCSAAQGGEILVAELVRTTAGRRATQTFRSRGRIELKGLAEPLPTTEVLWGPPPPESLVPLPVRLGDGPPVGFFGRSAELASLVETLKAVNGGGGRRLVLVSGEPGMGKTTLCGEFARQAHGQGATVLYGRCEDELAVPYG